MNDADDRRNPWAGLEADTEELYESAPCAHLSTRPDGTIIRANRTLLEWLGAESADIVGRVRFQNLLTIGSRIYYETHYAPLLQMQGIVNEIALEIRRTDGTVRPVVISARQLRSADGSPLLNRLALFDSTDRRRYEPELLEARKRAERATRELATVLREKTEFMAVLAHELRNPLAPIRNALELLRGSAGEPLIVEKSLATMRRQSEQLVRLVDDLFDVSRIDQHKLSLHKAPVDLVSLIHNAAEGSMPVLDDAGVTYRVTLPDQPIYIDADAARLAQVIGNLLNNAAKFTPRGGAVTLGIERAGDEAVISITDTGIGIDADDLPRIFDLFTQIAAPSESRSGLGIGLTLAKTLIEQHGGQIAVRSAGRGHGTEFVVRLPALASAPETVAKSSLAASASKTAGAPRRILVVDDNRDSAEMLGMLLGASGHDVRFAYDGLSAVESVTSFDPHVVLLDLGLPILDGYEAARRIKAQPKPAPFIVALTGWGQAEDRRKTAAAGFDAHLLKPVDHDELTALIAAVPSHG